MTFRPATLCFLAACLATAACSAPLMRPPEAIAANVDVYPVQGRQGLVVTNPAIAFGPYRTSSIHRGVHQGAGSGQATGPLRSEERREDAQDYDFELQGPGSGPWRGHCTAYSERHTETAVTGAHVGSAGSGVDSEETVVSASAGYTCKLEGPAGQRWTLDADAELRRGTVRDASGGEVVSIEPTIERWTPKHPQLVGNTLVDPGGEVRAALQQSFDGAVYLRRDLDANDKMAMAAVCTGLLIAASP